MKIIRDRIWTIALRVLQEYEIEMENDLRKTEEDKIPFDPWGPG